LNKTKISELMIDVIPKVMQSIRVEMRECRGDKLSVPQFRLLAAINQGIIKNKELGERLGVSEAAISRMLDLLSNEGLIKKGTSKIDRRQSVITLTKDGQKLFKTIKEDATDKMAQKLNSLDSADLEALLKALILLQSKLISTSSLV